MVRRPSPEGPCGLVQIIHVIWDKSARGGPSARTRNAVPSVLEIPEVELVDLAGMLYVTVSRWGGDNAFAEPASIQRDRVSVTDGYAFGCVQISHTLEGLQVLYLDHGGYAGAPNRWYLNATCGDDGTSGRTLHVPTGEWVQVCFNGRFSNSDTGNWWYKRTTVNVAWFASRPNGSIFLKKQPVQNLRLLADLW